MFLSQYKNNNSQNEFDFYMDYKLQNKIGEGAFSDVWLCVRQNSGVKYAAKILKKNYGKNASTTTLNAIPEVKVMNCLKDHPFLLMMVGFYYEENTGKIILITELMKKSLYDVIKNGECPLAKYTIKTYTYQMLEGLKYMHESGFIHRDIKPENILLGQRDKILKIGDFGTACHDSEGRPHVEYVATRWYRSPECILTRGWYGKKMDIWAVGCVIFEMATGRPLFDGRDENDQMEKIDWVLGNPDARLLNKFKKNKSNVFIERFETGRQIMKYIVGSGLHKVYQPYNPEYDILKEMIVYDPAKRFSADRLLRKPYFRCLRNTQYEYKLREFESNYRNESTNGLSKGENKWNITENKQLSTNKKQGPDGDLVPNLLPNMIQDICNLNLEKPHEEKKKLKKCKIVEKSYNTNLNNQKPNHIYSTVSTKTIFPIGNQLIIKPSKNTLKIKTKNSYTNRPPFK